jgi:hypothetical protein
LNTTLDKLPAPPRFRSRAAIRWLLVIGAVSPAVMAFIIQKKNWVNIPIWDEWDTPGIALLHFMQRCLTWGDLLAQHNESRKVVPRLIHIAIASVAGWDVRQGMVLTFVCACAVSLCALIYLRRHNLDSHSHILVPWLLMNLFLFAPSQYENFLSGFAFEFFIPFLCLFGCCAINLSRWPLPAKAACNSFLALLSTYTFAHGILLWAVAIPLPTREERPRRMLLVLSYALYAVIGVASVAGYFIGYKRPDVAPPLPGLADLPQLLHFVIVWLGSIVRSPMVNPTLGGLIFSAVMLATVFFTYRHLRVHKEQWRKYYPWLLLLAFTMACGALTAIGRVTIGVGLVFNTWFNGFNGMRYNATSVFAYVAVIGLLVNLYRDRFRSEPVWRIRFLFGLTACSTLLAVAWLEMFSDESIRVKQFQANRRRARTASIWINALPQNPEIFLAYPYPDFFWQRVEAMRNAGLLTLPKVSEPLKQAISHVPGASDFYAGHLDIAQSLPPGYFRFAGWARTPVKQAVADYVVLGWEENDNLFHPFTAIPTGKMRPDVAAVVGPSSLKAGFDQDIETSRLPPEAETIKAWAIDWETQQAFPLDGVLRLDRPRS